MARVMLGLGYDLVLRVRIWVRDREGVWLGFGVGGED